MCAGDSRGVPRPGVPVEKRGHVGIPPGEPWSTIRSYDAPLHLWAGTDDYHVRELPSLFGIKTESIKFEILSSSRLIPGVDPMHAKTMHRRCEGLRTPPSRLRHTEGPESHRFRRDVCVLLGTNQEACEDISDCLGHLLEPGRS